MGCCASERSHDPHSTPKSSLPPTPASSQSQSSVPSRKVSAGDEASMLNTNVSDCLIAGPSAQVLLKAKSCVQHLSGPLSLHYNFIAKLESTRGRSLMLAEFISTRKRCVIEKVSKKQGGLTRAKSREQAFDTARRLDHPHIRKLYEVVQDSDYIYIVSEVCDGGELADLLRNKQKLPTNQAAMLMNQLFSVLHYCHNMEIVHGKLSLGSLALKEKPTHTSVNVRVSGFCKTKEEAWLPAPETLGGEATAHADIWSCGVIMYRLLTGIAPFKAGNGFWNVTFPAGSQANISADAVSLIRQMLSVNPRDRPSASECLAHPWVQRFASPVSLASKESRKHLANLRTGITSASLREAVLRFILDRVVAQEQIDKVTKTFEALDVNGDGILSKEELKAGLCIVMPEVKAQGEVEKIMRRVAISGNDQIDYSAFLLVSLGDDTLLSNANLLTAFQSFDLDGSGNISVEELKKVFNVGKDKGEGAAWNALIKEIDTSGDGEIDFGEFCALMRRASN